jgi:uncharacterized Fe-S cluster-containing MiaB family protein
LLCPPFLSEGEGLEWAVRSVEWALSRGVDCCLVIPTRGGNGMLEQLGAAGQFAPPTLRSLERSVERGLAFGRGRVFADLWDIERIFDCPTCSHARADRLARMNLSQAIEPPVACDACG